MSKGLEFDPGFAPYILAFEGSIDYMYRDINRFKNLSQKKMKFRQYYKKILDIFYNNLGFYIGCLMWAGYIKTQDEQEVLNNHCFGKEYNKEEDTHETDIMIKFAELFPKDMKYFLGETFEFEPYVMKVLTVYKEFLCINNGFTDTKTNADVKLPPEIKCKKAESFKKTIDKILKDGNLSKFAEHLSELSL